MNGRKSIVTMLVILGTQLFGLTQRWQLGDEPPPFPGGEVARKSVEGRRGVARNLILHYWREQRTARVVADSELLDLVAQAHDETSDHRAERRQALLECIDRLPEKSKRLLRMKYDQGLSFAAMAERLRRSADGLKMALCRVRRALLECAESRLRLAGPQP